MIKRDSKKRRKSRIRQRYAGHRRLGVEFVESRCMLSADFSGPVVDAPMITSSLESAGLVDISDIDFASQGSGTRRVSPNDAMIGSNFPFAWEEFDGHSLTSNNELSVISDAEFFIYTPSPSGTDVSGWVKAVTAPPNNWAYSNAFQLITESDLRSLVTVPAGSSVIVPPATPNQVDLVTGFPGGAGTISPAQRPAIDSPSKPDGNTEFRQHRSSDTDSAETVNADADNTEAIALQPDNSSRTGGKVLAKTPTFKVTTTQKMVDITRNLASRPQTHNTSNSGTQIDNTTFETSLALTTSHRVISTTSVSLANQLAKDSQSFIHVVHSSDEAAAEPQYASRSRAQAFEILDLPSQQTANVSLESLFEQANSSSTWTRYTPAHVPVSTISPEIESNSHAWPTSLGSPAELTNIPIPQPTATIGTTSSLIDRSLIDGEKQSADKVVRSNRRAASMVFTVIAIQQVWRYDRRKHPLATRFGTLRVTSMIRGKSVNSSKLDSADSRVKLLNRWWSTVKQQFNVWREWQARRRAPRPLFPVVNSRVDQRY